MNGIEIISLERKRQIVEERRSMQSDVLNNQREELAIAAAAYASPLRTRKYRTSSRVPMHWPWDVRWWKPTPEDRIRELAKAGALIAAEIDRIQHVLSPSFTADIQSAGE